MIGILRICKRFTSPSNIISLSNNLVCYCYFWTSISFLLIKNEFIITFLVVFFVLSFLIYWSISLDATIEFLKDLFILLGLLSVNVMIIVSLCFCLAMFYLFFLENPNHEK